MIAFVHLMHFISNLQENIPFLIVFFIICRSAKAFVCKTHRVASRPPALKCNDNISTMITLSKSTIIFTDKMEKYFSGLFPVNAVDLIAIFTFQSIFV